MKKILPIILLCIALLVIIGCDDTKKILGNQPDGLYAVLKVNGEDMLIKLHYQETPLTVTNFVGLATGKFAEHVEREGNFYDGITFHRVVEDFVIQGGDPSGNGTGGPGYIFPDEINDDLQHDEMGVLSMANSGPDTNGSQFFITLAPTPHLNGRHTVFGKVVEGADIIPTVQQNDTIDSIRVYAKGKDAQSFVDNITWEGFQELITTITEEKANRIAEKKQRLLSALNSGGFEKTADGIFYKVIVPGIGRKIRTGDNAEVHYDLRIYGSEDLIDSSYERNQPFTLEVGANSVIRGWELILLELKKGEKIRAVIPPELAYGSRGAGATIPPDAFLDFTMEIVDIK